MAKVVDIENHNGIKVLVFDKNIAFLVNKETGEIKDDYLTNRVAIIEGFDIRKVKHSPIIDLIEVGDYVNGKLIEDIINYKIGDTESRLLIYNKKDMKGTDIRAGAFYEDDIKSVVTKEQFNAIEYKVDE